MKWTDLANTLLIAIATGDRETELKMYAVMDEKKKQKKIRKATKKKYKLHPV